MNLRNPPSLVHDGPRESVSGTANSPTAISLRGVTKRYKDKCVLDRLDLEIPAGSVTGLLGKNGAGKTTLIKCAMGLVRPQEGEIRVLGEPAWDLSAQAKARLGYVPQIPQPYSWMRIRQIIAYTAAFYSTWNQGLVDRLTREWELDPEARIGPLSVGQLQKLSILLALGHEPELLVLDEPAAALDPAARREFLQTILQIAADGGRTVLFSTHITSDLERVADRVAIMQAGKITYNGELDVLKDQVKRLRVTATRPLPARLEIAVMAGSGSGIPAASLLSNECAASTSLVSQERSGRDAASTPEAPVILHQKVEGHEALVSVRACTLELVAALEAKYGATVEVRNLNLEDIFLEMHDG